MAEHDRSTSESEQRQRVAEPPCQAVLDDVIRPGLANPDMAEPRTRRPRVIVTRRLTPSIEARMAELFDARLNQDDRPAEKTTVGVYRSRSATSAQRLRARMND